MRTNFAGTGCTFDFKWAVDKLVSLGRNVQQIQPSESGVFKAVIDGRIYSETETIELADNL